MRRLLNDIASKLNLQKLINVDSLVQLKRYIIVGLTSFAVEYTMFFVLYKQLNLWYVLSNGIVYAITFWISFLLNRNWSFQSKGKFSRQLVLYLLLFIINLTISSYLIYLLSDKFIINPLFSKILTMGLIITWNFIIYKKIIYIER